MTLVVMLAYRSARKLLSPLVFLSGLSFKLLCGVLVGLLYQYHYDGGDTFYYYQQALIYVQRDDFWRSVTETVLISDPVRAIWFSRCVAVLIYVTHADYWLCAIYFSVFSFLGVCYAVCKLTIWLPSLRLASIIALFYFPSTVFWSSGLLKESLAFAAVFIIVGFYAGLQSGPKRRWYDYMLLSCALGVLIVLKYYIAALLLPALVFVWVYHWSENRMFATWPFWLKSGMLAAAMLLPVWFFLHSLSYNFSWEKFSVVIQSNHLFILSETHAANRLPVIHVTDTVLDDVINVLYFAFSGLFRPLIGESFYFPFWLSSVENTFLLIGAIGIFKRKVFIPPNLKPEILAMLAYVILCALFLSYSVPNLGTIARYKVYYLPFLVMLIVGFRSRIDSSNDEVQNKKHNTK
ncbi:hypothetical protein N6H18_04270 [Reichenbachiella agarivorans]|uniref:Dolichyl-phosphate-mannose-protein mannosyltransferase n=1 Tax=Reichenbachiella agarivorans TaxID=2979464 RepID=A0ABY6CS53_9BACT|nr:hypothetical protein [Reichenbachiella agarivorans]UXP33169.1 hypothetical protein N6H18_04270 [Reichenbachiella agarivorans]